MLRSRDHCMTTLRARGNPGHVAAVSSYCSGAPAQALDIALGLDHHGVEAQGRCMRAEQCGEWCSVLRSPHRPAP